MLQPTPMKKIAEKNQGKANYRLTLQCQCGRQFVHKPGQKNSIPGPMNRPTPQCPQCKNVWIGDERVQEQPQHEKRQKDGTQYFRTLIRHDDHYHTVHVGRAHSWRDYVAKIMGMIHEDTIPGLYFEPISKAAYRAIRQEHEQAHQQAMAQMGHMFMGPHIQPMSPEQAAQFMQEAEQKKPSAAEQFQQAMEEQNGHGPMHGFGMNAHPMGAHPGMPPMPPGVPVGPPMKGIVITGNLSGGLPPGLPPQVVGMLGALAASGMLGGPPGKGKKARKKAAKKQGR